MRGWVALLIFGVVAGLASVQAQGSFPTSGPSQTVSLLDGDMTLTYQKDATGLWLKASAKTLGWIGVGLGGEIMSGSMIYMGFVTDGKPQFSQEKAKGHTHHPVPVTIDHESVTQKDGMTILVVHVPSSQLPSPSGSIPFIAAFADSADFTTFHEDHHDSGVLHLP